MKSMTFGAVALVSLGMAGTASAADYTWQGAAEDWTATGNWKNGS